MSQKKGGEDGEMEAGVERSVEEEYNLSQYSSDESGGEGELWVLLSVLH